MPPITWAKLRPKLRKTLISVVSRGGINPKKDTDIEPASLAELETLGLVRLVTNRKGRPLWRAGLFATSEADAA